jgi:hypothetical protein
MKRYERFFVAPGGGAPGNEYRIAGDQVQFRVVNNSQPTPIAGRWHTLDGNDILMHLTLDTSVGKWLTTHSQKAALTARRAA